MFGAGVENVYVPGISGQTIMWIRKSTEWISTECLPPPN